MAQRSPAGPGQATLSEVPGTELQLLRATFGSFRDFVDHYSPWLSESCIFVETEETLAIGAPVRLEIRLRGRPVMVRALGEVGWTRPPAAGDDGPPGVALDVTFLDPASARLIDSIFRRVIGQRSTAARRAVAPGSAGS